MALASGKLRHRVEIQNPVEVQDQDTGAMEVTWVTIATVWAAIEPVSAREFVASESETSKVVARVTIRYRKNIDAKMRLYHRAKGFYYNIEGILSDKDSGLEYLTLPVSEGVRYYEGSPAIPVNLTPPEIYILL